MLSAGDVYDLVVHHINKYGARGFLFSDDDFFVGNRQGIHRVLDFCGLIVEAKKKGAIPEETVFNCQAHVTDFLKKDSGNQGEIDWELLDALKAAAFHSFGLGVETFSDRLLKCPSINKVGVRERTSRNVLDALGKKGLVPTINIILMIPESTIDDMIHSMKVATEYILKGYQVAMTPLMYAFPGAPVYGRREYPIRTKKWTNPHNKDVVTIVDYFVPHDKRLADIVDQIKRAEVHEVENIRRNSPWKGPAIPKPVSALCICSSIMKLLKRYDLADYFTNAVYELVERENSGAGRAACSGFL
jgi:radical SAM superfamily enzyme YgiQ (UPF0313 family)